MIVYPAIDVLDGQAVRLAQGDYDRVTAYDADPVAAAMRWVDEGAKFLHVVDLDGARSGSGQNLDAIGRIVEQAPVPVQVGGGLRDRASVERYLEMGVARAIVGSMAVEDPDEVCAIAESHGEAIVASVDSRDGMAASDGWTRSSKVTAPDLVERLARGGVRRFVHTPVEADGLLEGPSLEGLTALCDAAGSSTVIYSGGVGSLADLEALLDASPKNVEGVIVGRALYEGVFSLREAIDCLGNDRDQG